jgi:hypothetical protein
MPGSRLADHVHQPDGISIFVSLFVFVSLPALFASDLPGNAAATGHTGKKSPLSMARP